MFFGGDSSKWKLSHNSCVLFWDPCKARKFSILVFFSPYAGGPCFDINKRILALRLMQLSAILESSLGRSPIYTLVRPHDGPTDANRGDEVLIYGMRLSNKTSLDNQQHFFEVYLRYPIL